MAALVADEYGPFTVTVDLSRDPNSGFVGAEGPAQSAACAPPPKITADGVKAALRAVVPQATGTARSQWLAALGTRSLGQVSAIAKKFGILRLRRFMPAGD